MSRILVVDDEPQIRRFLRAALAAQQYEVLEAGTVREAISTATTERPEMVILDLGLPDGDGITVVQNLRTWTQIPILVLSVRGQEVDKVAALDAGADDYLTKPFSTAELLARLRAAMRRTGRLGEDALFSTGGLVVDTARRMVTVDGQEVHLTATEYALLQTLVLNAGKVLTHKQLLSMVWGAGYENEAHILRVNISNLRRKLEHNPLQPQYVVTEPGVGYRLRMAGA
ncbi:MAG TPA: response regulator [Symbiobacteriaceae bacterium]|jgi:two-component system KDP operon response regulator KdpE|nr:response regulator [Symbiobacteriaceae bacterium]